MCVYIYTYIHMFAACIHIHIYICILVNIYIYVYLDHSKLEIGRLTGFQKLGNPKLSKRKTQTCTHHKSQNRSLPTKLSRSSTKILEAAPRLQETMPKTLINPPATTSCDHRPKVSQIFCLPHSQKPKSHQPASPRGQRLREELARRSCSSW